MSQSVLLALFEIREAWIIFKISRIIHYAFLEFPHVALFQVASSGIHDEEMTLSRTRVFGIFLEFTEMIFTLIRSGLAINFL